MMVEFAGQSSRDEKNEAANTGRLLNCYREPVMIGGKTGHVLMPAPGMTNIHTLSGIFMRAMETIRGEIYTVCGGNLYRIPQSGSPVLLGAVTNAEDTTISGHDGFVTVAAGGNYYTWNGSTLTSPSPGAFTSFGAVDTESGYTVLTEKSGKRWQWSDLANPANLPGTNFGTAEQRDDNLIRPFVVGGLVWLFGERSIEIWTRTGAAGSGAFEFMAGGVHDVGLKALGLAVKFDGGAFFVGDDDIVYLTNGTGIHPILVPPVASAIGGCNPLTCVHFEDRGHKFCAIIFEDCPAWVYDLATGEWFERSEGVNHDPWGVAASAKMGSNWFVGRDNGTVAKLEQTNADTGSPLVREFVSRTIYQDGERFRIAELELFGRKGLDVPAWGNCSASVYLSGDGGFTWGKERVVSFGDLGRFADRAILRALGQFRQLTVKVRISDPAHVPLYSTHRLRAA